ncbi:iron chelate uptake ABC transporter family permease subunit [Amycolatopsis carbonis]|uniref:Iron chelate uptake ABC transporter family permease subunit n=1 Tax=Amycolatopsis carbonis TaxID=715471 RepID=A0A9Y2I9Z4_9PSEU|nr:iron chelate uptake ABC transporter family permease subunit [Amycolatopsis sp. 2-15]WIX76049.1 iron chelate uptake ABC transporter family permease subunit [Amycolatopsis sp. 2-15]
MVVSVSPPVAAGPPAHRGRARALRGGGLVCAVALLVLIMLVSLWVGSKSIPFGSTWSVLWHNDGSADAVIIHDQRLPRTLLGALVGAALGLAGAVMQALTRNPLADPGLLGVNNGAAAAVVSAIAFTGVTTVLGYVWFAFLGAAVASVVVYLLGTAGRGGATPDRLVMSGAALTAVLQAYIGAVLLIDPDTFNQFRFWNVGSLSGRRADVLVQVSPFIVIGIVLALLLARPLNVLALGEQTGKALGAHIGRTRVLGAIAVTLLCGASTAAIGPIAFIGLAVPQAVRILVGPDQRWVLPYSMILSPVLLIGSDVIGRILNPPEELQVGIVTAFLGAPVFIALCRRRKLARL